MLPGPQKAKLKVRMFQPRIGITHIKRFLFVLLFLTVTCAILFGAVINSRFGAVEPEIGYINRNPLIASDLPRNFSGLALFCNITSISPLDTNFNIRLVARPVGDLSISENHFFKAPASSLYLTIGALTNVYGANQIMPSSDAVIDIKSGSPISYPFDVYKSDIYIVGKLEANSTDTGNTIPLSISVANNMEDWSVLMSFTDISLPGDNQPFSLIYVSFVFRRGHTQIFFSIFVVILMWALSISILSLAIIIVLYHQRVEFTMIVLNTNLGCCNYHAFCPASCQEYSARGTSYRDNC